MDHQQQQQQQQQQAQLQQPDYAVVSRCFTDLAVQAPLFANVPIVDGGVGVVQILQQLQASVQQLQASVQQLQASGQQTQASVQQTQASVQQINTRLARMEDRLNASDTNAAARAWNSGLTSPDQPLEQLHDIRTNEPIPNFPATSAELNNMQCQELSGILAALGLRTQGTAELKKMWLRAAIGLSPSASA